MIDIDSIRSYIEEVYSEACSPFELAELHAEIVSESKRQLEYCMNCRIKECVKNET